ncbi:MAG TPA: glycerate kinase [Deltaproteobacteria bacterium]|nr:glycerate kinase [Deltaproteobacteria bacterium]
MNPPGDLRSIFLAAVESVDPYLMITGNVSVEGGYLVIRHEGRTVREELSAYREIVVLGIGKASARMGRAMEEILGGRLARGTLITKYGHAERLSRIEVLEAGHPIPDQSSVDGARVLHRIASEADGRTLIINLLSGGGSALLTLPLDGVSLHDIQEMTRLLLESGADITEINCLRKHLSQVKGGHFARASFPARTISLILSDVVGDRLDTIASGISVADNTTYAQARDILDKYRIQDRIPQSIARIIQSGIEGRIPDTPKEGDPVFANVTNVLLGNNLAACRAARSAGEKLGYRPHILTSTLTGEAREIARFFASMARDLDRGVSDFTRPALLITGGETTVTIRGSGKGGRNQEMALAFLTDFMDNDRLQHDIAFLSAGTDGNDGPTDAAGAVVDIALMKRVKAEGLNPAEYLADNDAYHFFERTGALLKTGPTGTNVCDIQLLAVV